MSYNWNADLYLSFEKQRIQPGIDLIQRLPPNDGNVKKIMDLGCGGGNLIPFLIEKYSNSCEELIALDNSKSMLEKARKRTEGLRENNKSKVKFIEKDLMDFELKENEYMDVIFSNATLHWVENQEAVFNKYFDMLKPGGILGVQLPYPKEQWSHKGFKEAGRQCGVDDLLKDVQSPVQNVEDMNFYYNLLNHRSVELNLWYTEYIQVLSGDNPVAKYTESTSQLVFRDQLRKTGGEEKLNNWVKTYESLVLKHYPKLENGKTLFPFKRFFLIAIKK